MLTLLASLIRHQSWADATLLTAVQAHPDSLRDEQMLKTLHHIVRTQRFFLSRFLDRPFDKEKESQRPEAFDPNNIRSECPAPCLPIEQR